MLGEIKFVKSDRGVWVFKHFKKLPKLVEYRVTIEKTPVREGRVCLYFEIEKWNVDDRFYRTIYYEIVDPARMGCSLKDLRPLFKKEISEVIKKKITEDMRR